MITIKPRFTLRNIILRAIIIPAGLLFLLFIFVAIFGSLYVTTSNEVLLILMIVFSVLTGTAYLIFSFYYSKRLYDVFHNDLYKITKTNYAALSDNSRNLDRYPSKDIEEFSELNEDVDELYTRFASGYLIASTPDYSKTSLEFISKEKNLVTYDSFRKELHNIIFLSQSYQNVLIDADFNNDNIVLEKEDEEYLLITFENAFKDYRGRLYIYNEVNKSFMIYLPVVDSFSRIRELLYLIIRECSASIREVKGTSYIPLRFNIVCYPYSDVEEMLTDIRYAKRQGKLINFYLPNRIKTNYENNTLLISNSMNINVMNRIVSPLLNLSYSRESFNRDKERMLEFFKGIITYLELDEAGIILYDEILRKYQTFIKTDKGNETDMLLIIDDLMESLHDSIDDDRSYFFISRSHANNSLGRCFDIVGINSGLFYLLKKEGQDIGFIYFIKRKDDFIIDTYIKECLMVSSLRLEHYFLEMNFISDIDLYRSETEYVLSLSNYSLYKVDDDMHITFFSKDLKNKFKNLEIGKYCYEAFYGLDRMCSNCPMKSFKKKVVEIDNERYIISLTLNDRKTHNRSLLVEKEFENIDSHDLYDNNLLINSYLSLRMNLENSYRISGRGYILLLSIDNLDKIIANQGSEGALFVLRSFIRNLKNLLKNDEIYYYNQNTLALMLYGLGHVDILNLCEEIYELSKEHYLDTQAEDTLNITYLPLGWPRGYASAVDFLRHVLDFYQNGQHPRNRDFIYFSDHSISRSASKRFFMLQVIETEFSSSTFSSVSLQPIVKAKDKRIFGAEILLRINNVYSNRVFNAEEISRIAEQEGKTSLITESIINFIGTMYKEYGQSIFKINEFSRFCINIDSTYLKDPTLVKGIIALNDTYNFPNYFLSFEIPEDIIPDHVSQIQKMAKELSSARIYFSVDRYTGKYMSVDKLKELGFNEIKLTRDLIGKIDTDSVRYNEVKDIIAHAKESKILVAAVGVENSAQYTILRDLDDKMMMQGFHFFKPLSRSDFIAALISHNN